MNDKLRGMLRLGSLLLWLGVGLTLWSQKAEIRGQVRDAETGERLPLVTVRLDSTSYGSNTNLDGDFSLFALPR